MTGALYLAFLAVLVAGYGAKDARLMRSVAASSRGSGARSAMIVFGVSCAVAAAIMAYGGAFIGAMLSASAKPMFVALALLLAGAELVWPIGTEPRDPPPSPAGLFILLLARQIGDGPRLLVLATAAATQAPVLAAIGGALGGAASGVAFLALQDMNKDRTRAWRLTLGLATIASAVWMGLAARGLI